MALRLCYKVKSHNVDCPELRIAKVYKDVDWEEYRVKFWERNVYLKDADYHTAGMREEDLRDAKQTAKAFILETAQKVIRLGGK